MARRTPSPQLFLFIATLAMLAGSILPLRLTGWLGWFRGPFMTVVAPISTPLASLSGWLRPAETRGPAVERDKTELRQELEFYKAEYLRLEQQVTQLQDVIRALQSDVPFGPSLRLKRLEATRVGADLAAGAIDVSRGSIHGVTLNTVAVATSAPQHLVGVVTSVGPTVSTVHVITDRRIAPNLVEALLVPSGSLTAEAIARAPRCQFRPVGDGTLVGDLGVEDAQRLQRGDTAYLDDPYWPSTAQRLILGRVLRVDDTDKPLFKRVSIRPDFDLTRVRGVVLRIPEGSGDAEPVGGAGGGTP